MAETRDADNVPSDPANAIPVQSIEGGPVMPPEFWEHVQAVGREQARAEWRRDAPMRERLDAVADADNIPSSVMRCDDPETYARGYNAGYADAHRHDLANDDDLDDLIERGGCTLAPEGWWCSLPEGHDGPCPARPEPMPTDRAGGTIPNEVALRAERDAAYADAAYAEECARTALDRAEAAEAELASEGAQHQEARQDLDALRAEVEQSRRIASSYRDAAADYAEAVERAEKAEAEVERLLGTDDSDVPLVEDEDGAPLPESVQAVVRDLLAEKDRRIEWFRGELSRQQNAARQALPMLRRLGEAEATIARVEALADHFEESFGPFEGSPYLHAASQIRAALRGPEPTEGA